MSNLRCPKCLRHTVRLDMSQSRDSYYCMWRKYKRTGGCDWSADPESYDKGDHEQMAALRAANPQEGL